MPFNEPVLLPTYLKLSQILLGVITVFFTLWIGQDIIIPLAFATMIAILLNPVVKFLCRKRVPRIIGIILSILVAMCFIAGVMYFLFSQASLFSESLPEFKNKGLELFSKSQQWVGQKLNIPQEQLNAWLKKTKAQELENGKAILGQTIGTVGGTLVVFFILPVYIFMILYYKPLLLEFISRLFPREHHKTVVDVLDQTKTVIQSYLIGLLIEALLVATLNSLGLIFLGIKYAVLIGVIGAFLNVIPYIGGVIAVAIPMLLALATKEPIYTLYVLIVYMVVQFIDNNILVPRIVASKVKINALVSIVVVLIGNALWGVPGMFLSLPMTAIVKVIFDRIPALEPFGFVLGDNLPDFTKQFFYIRGKRSKVKTMRA